ncbi:MAG: tRNA methyltransferase ppm2 [Thelocarpon superellum]|nr:MAG: tRNA methyltransferase ppm2 [Thelocarpon superellum]
MSGLDLGSCREKWTLQYLKDCINVNRLVCGELSDRVAAANFLQVVIHQAQSDRMNFLSKNFSYVTRRWHDFLDQVDEGERVYLRSLSAEQPIQRPADLARDFPEIAGEFQLPPALSFVKEHAHSSPLRISGPVALWLHYDVMANVLCQVRGQKRLVLYAPSEVRSLQIPAGATSSHLDVFDDATGAYPPLNNAPRHEANLEPGDVLYIPPLWAHAAAPTQGPSIAVNVFFRNLSDGYAAGRDVYGNRDLQAYEKGRLEIARLVRSFAPLPGDVRRFYLERLSDELLCLAHEPASSPS